MKKLLCISTIKCAPLSFILLFTFTFSLFTHLCEAQYTDLIDFTGTSGSYIGEWPMGSFTLSGDTLYGMTSDNFGISSLYGNIFSVQTNGTNYKVLVNFTGDSGSYTGSSPYGSLILSGDTLYGMTQAGGIHGFGNIFSVQTNGTNYKDLIDFTGNSGSYIGTYPYNSSLNLSGDTLYGMTQGGGPAGYGIIFSVQTNGTNFKDLIEFTGTSGSYIGKFPFGSLTLSGDTLYGMTSEGGVYSEGNIFSVQTNGTNFKDLIDFDTTGSYIGADPLGSLILSGDTLYGMTSENYRLSPRNGNIFSVQTNGTNYIDLLDFTGTSGSYIGKYPAGSLTLSGDVLYGMSFNGGINQYGNIFSVQTNGANFKDLVDFTDPSGSYIGEQPEGSLILSDNILYGMTLLGGVNELGNIFSFKDTTVTTSVNHLSVISGQINVFPNPNNGILTVALSHAELVSASQTKMEVYNVFGEQVYYATLKQVQGDNKVDISSQPNGVYLYRVIAENGNLIGEGKLVVVH